MTWNCRSGRWFKKHNFVQYAVSQRTLRKLYPHLYVTPTKEGSYRAANRWWEDKLSTLSVHPQQMQLDEAISDRKLAAEWCCLAGDEDTRKRFLAEIDLIRTAKEKGIVADLGPNGLQLGSLFLDFQQRIAGSDSVWPSRLEEVKRHLAFVQTEQSETTSLAKLIDKFLRQKSNEVCVKQFRNIKRHVQEFADWWKCDNVSLLKSLVVAEYRDELADKVKEGELSDTTAHAKLKHVKMLIHWLYEIAAAIEQPRALQKITIAVDDTENPTWTVEQIKTLLANSTDEQKVWWLLCLNCGMYQGDLGQLAQSELDLAAGTITRRRSKRKNGGLRVTYKLWPEILTLLGKCVSAHPSLVFVDGDGQPLWEERKNSTKDTIGARFSSIKDNNPELPRLKDLRKTGATLISNRFDKALADYYLAHGAKDIADRSYLAHQNDRLREATDYLRQMILG